MPQQRFEVLGMDLFGPLPEGDNGEKWMFLVEDTASRWVELFALRTATAETCAKALIEEVFLHFGLPRLVISDNGSQFVSTVIQKAMFVLGVQQSLIPVYHMEANPTERNNRAQAADRDASWTRASTMAIRKAGCLWEDFPFIVHTNKALASLQPISRSLERCVVL